jgi:hypothetical protein
MLTLFFLLSYSSKSQIANYVNNGGFEIPKSNNLQKAKYWDAIDTTKFVGLMYSKIISPFLVPLSSLTYQWPKSGNNYFITSLYFKPNTIQTIRGYPRNILKQTLQAGKTYCVKFHYNITNNTTYGVDGLGAYFGGNTTDTISQCMNPISYLTPQIQNPTNNIITDTLNWIPITGTFVANGTEKYMMLGNFKSDLATNTLLINPTGLPLIFCDVVLDDVSVIDTDLPAYAGADIWGIPTNTVYLGRPCDVGIDEACMWYKLPNTTTAIDTAAGITITVAATTQTYMVKQDICGMIKYDTVVVYASGVGLSELEFMSNNISIYPNPANDILNVNLNFDIDNTFSKIKIVNNLGQIIREEEINFKNKTATIKTDDLENGVYVLVLYSSLGDKRGAFSKRFVITR